MPPTTPGMFTRVPREAAAQQPEEQNDGEKRVVRKVDSSPPRSPGPRRGRGRPTRYSRSRSLSPGARPGASWSRPGRRTSRYSRSPSPNLRGREEEEARDDELAGRSSTHNLLLITINTGFFYLKNIK